MKHKIITKHKNDYTQLLPNSLVEERNSAYIKYQQAKDIADELYVKFRELDLQIRSYNRIGVEDKEQ